MSKSFQFAAPTPNNTPAGFAPIIGSAKTGRPGVADIQEDEGNGFRWIFIK